MKSSNHRAARRAATLVALLALGMPATRASAQRVLGVDVSDWQQEDFDHNPLQPIDWTLVHKPTAQGGGGKDFAFIRATRGGTTGTFDKWANTGTLGHRYDDYRFQENINNATAAGVLSGPYHFLKADILSYTLDGQTVTHTGRDEADHFLQVAGPYIRPGYLLPVCDVEAGATQRSKASLSAFVADFADRVYEVKGVRPIVYINQNYANNEVDDSLPPHMGPLWIARWPNQTDPGSIDVQKIHPPPSPSTANVYGVWNPNFTVENPYPDGHPWSFWQYASTGKNIPGLLGDRNGNTDLNVAQGDIEFVRDHQVPALWTTNASGSWNVISNWNTNADPSGFGGPARLPGAGDNVLLDRPDANVTISFPAGQIANIRRLNTFETLNLNGGMLNVARQADIGATLNLNAGTFSAGAITVHPGGSVNLSGGTLLPTTLTVAGGTVDVMPALTAISRTLRVSSVSVSAGQINLRYHKMIVDYTGDSPIGSFDSSAYSGVTGLIASGRNGGAWDGTGIITSQPDAAALVALTSIGIAEASQLLGIAGTQTATWRGQTVDATSLLAMYTYAGDATLDGVINVDDYGRIDGNVAQADSVSGWYNGDFNYDGRINIDDYGIIDANISAQGAPLASEALASTAAVPEPAGLTLALSSLLLLRRRK